MNTKVKYALIISGAVCAAYLALTLTPELEKRSHQRAVQAVQNAAYERNNAAREKLATSFAKCAADSLAPQYLKQFITYELMPLGIAWQLAIQDSKLKSPDYHAAILLKNHFRLTLSDESFNKYERNLQRRIKHYGDLAEGRVSTFDLSTFEEYPSSLVYQTLGTSHFENVRPEDIDLGDKKIEWPKFRVLAQRCKGTPNDLRELARAPSMPSEPSLKRETDSTIVEEMDYGSLNGNSEYAAMKREFWTKLSATSAYKDALAEIKTENARIIQKVIQENEPLEQQRRAQKKATDAAIFKNP